MILGDLVIIGGLMIFGIVGVIALVLEGFWRMLRFAAGPLTRRGRLERHAREQARSRYARPVRLCTHPRCGYLNPDNARYCARCGRPLEDSDVDNYG